MDDHEYIQEVRMTVEKLMKLNKKILTVVMNYDDYSHSKTRSIRGKIEIWDSRLGSLIHVLDSMDWKIVLKDTVKRKRKQHQKSLDKIEFYLFKLKKIDDEYVETLSKPTLIKYDYARISELSSIIYHWKLKIGVEFCILYQHGYRIIPPKRKNLTN